MNYSDPATDRFPAMSQSLTIKLGLLAILGLIVIAGLTAALFHQLRRRRAFHFNQAATKAPPASIHLEPAVGSTWTSSNPVARKVQDLRHLGFRVIGAHRIGEMDLHLIGLGHPQDQLGAVILETTDGDAVIEVMAHFTNGGTLTATTAANPGYPNHPNHERIFVKRGTSPKKLGRKLLEALGSRDLLPIHPGNFVAFFEETHARQAAWHREQVGPRDVFLRDPELDALSEPVFHRLKDRDVAGVEDFLKLGFSPEGRDYLGRTPLMVAITTGEPSLVRPLLDAGADPNTRAPGIPGRPPSDDQDSVARGSTEREAFVTPLSLAIETGSPAVMTVILGAGANLEGPGGPLLHFAAREGDLDMVRALVEAGAEIHQTDKEGMTPLHHAAQEGHPEAVEFLVSAGADIEARFGKKTTITLAAEAGAIEVVGLLELYVKRSQAKKARRILEKAEPMGDVKARRLINAALNGRTPMVRKLLAAGVPPDAREFDDEAAISPLIAATQNGHVDAMRALVEAGANVNDRGANGETVITLALRTPPTNRLVQQANGIRLLVRHGADLSSLDEMQKVFIEQCIHDHGPNQPD